MNGEKLGIPAPTRRSSGKQQEGRYKSLDPASIRNVKRCSECGEDHFAQCCSNGEDIKTAINKLKTKHSTALLIAEDLVAVYDRDDAHDEQLTDRDFDLIKGTEQDVDEKNVAVLFVPEELTNIKQHFEMSALLHGMGASDEDNRWNNMVVINKMIRN